LADIFRTFFPLIAASASSWAFFFSFASVTPLSMVSRVFWAFSFVSFAASELPSGFLSAALPPVGGGGFADGGGGETPTSVELLEVELLEVEFVDGAGLVVLSQPFDPTHCPVP
jgi:hypothetical protein